MRTQVIPPTIKQIADTLGLSHSTVSRALHNHPAISEVTKQRVSEEAHRSGYIPNNAARMLKQQSSHVLGLIIPDIKNTFYTSVAQIVAVSAAARGWQMILATTDDDPVREMAAVRSLLEARAGGVIISPSAKPLPDTVAMLGRLNAVQFLRTVKALGELPSVELDDAMGIEMATTHLLEQGHRRIGYIGTLTSLSTGKNRLKGHESALRKFGITRSEELCVFGPPRAFFGAAAFKEIMSQPRPPTAIVLGGPEIVEGVLIEAARQNVTIPRDISLVSYGEQAWHEVMAGGITSIRLPEQALAHATFELLMADKNSLKNKRVKIDPCLVIRGSSTPLPKTSVSSHALPVDQV